MRMVVLAEMINAILNFGPEPQISDSRLIDYFSVEGDFRPIYVLGGDDLCGRLPRATTHFHSVRSALEGRIFDRFLDARVLHLGPSAIDLQSDFPIDDGMGIRNVVRRYFGASQSAEEDGIQILSAWYRYWNQVIARLNIGAFYSYATPHTVHDIALYIACRHHDVMTRFHRATSVPGLSFLSASLVSGLRSAPSIGEASDAHLVDVQLSASAKQLRSTYDQAVPHYMKRQQTTSQSPELNFVRNLATRAVNTLRNNRTKAGDHQPDTEHVMLPDKRILSLSMPAYRKSQQSKIETVLKLAKVYRDQRILRVHYSRICKKRRFDPETPFIYVPLHYQPERTTAPEAGKWADQTAFVDNILRVLPDHWQVVIREHPSQFHVRFYGHTIQRHRMYERLMGLDKRVVFVPTSADPFRLIDLARGVGTPTGTSGWEALLRSKPVVCSRGAWYSGFPGTFAASDEDDMTAFIGHANVRLAEYHTQAMDALRTETERIVPVEYALNSTTDPVTWAKILGRAVTSSLHQH